MDDTNYLTSVKLKRKIYMLCRRYGKLEHYEDVYHSYCVDILEGRRKHQSILQFFIDYSRDNMWVFRYKERVIEIVEFLDSDIGVKDKEEGFEILNTLTKRDREIMLLYYKYGFLMPEIAEKLGLSPTGVGYIIRKSLKRLRKVRGYDY